MQIICAHCGKKAEKPNGAVNRARKVGLKIYCSRECSGLGRRNDSRTLAQKKSDKAAYDAEYRAKNRAILKEKKAAYYAANHDREKEREQRKERMHRHVEYCRRPEYREWKKEYDRKHRAKKFYGEFWESAILTLEIRDEALRIAGGDYELRIAKGYFNNTTKTRRRDYERIDRKEPQECALGDLERGERR